VDGDGSSCQSNQTGRGTGLEYDYSPLDLHVLTSTTIYAPDLQTNMFHEVVDALLGLRTYLRGDRSAQAQGRRVLHR